MLSMSLRYGEKILAVLLDEEDKDLCDLNWNIRPDKGNFYVQRTVVNYPYEYNEVIHKVVLERKLGRPLIDSEQADHKDRNGLNNTRRNLRAATKTQNAGNNIGWKNRDLPHGVTRNRNRFRARCSQGHIGIFATPEEAHKAFKRKHVEIYGEFSPYYEEK